MVESRDDGELSYQLQMCTMCLDYTPRGLRVRAPTPTCQLLLSPAKQLDLQLWVLCVLNASPQRAALRRTKSSAQAPQPSSRLHGKGQRNAVKMWPTNQEENTTPPFTEEKAMANLPDMSAGWRKRLLEPQLWNSPTSLFCFIKWPRTNFLQKSKKIATQMFENSVRACNNTDIYLGIY